MLPLPPEFSGKVSNLNFSILLTSHIMSYYNNLILGALTCLLAVIISVSGLSMLFHSKFDPRGKVRPNSPTSVQRMIWGSSAT